MLLKNKISALKQSLNNASSYAEWEQIGTELDHLLGFDLWKIDEQSTDYNSLLIRARLNLLREYRASNDLPRLIRSLREGLHHDLGNMGNPMLYGYAYIGTKKLIEDYVEEVCAALEHIAANDVPGFSAAEKLRLLKETSQSYGQPSLMLSGGATFGLFHIGVCKALHEQGLLPDVISGSSAGALMASVIGTHTEEELVDLYDGDGFYMHSWAWNGLWSGLRGEGFASQKQLEQFARRNIGEYTFEEAYARTGRHINVTVSPVMQHQKARLMNELTSPYLLVWSAALASCAVPVVFPAVRLTAKDVDGSYKPYMAQKLWVDGSVKSDLPRQRLMHLYDVNYFIVSQVNPHIVPFMESDQDRRERKLRSWPNRIVRAQLKFQAAGVLDFLRDHAGTEAARQALGHAFTMVSQRYNGDVTIAPPGYNVNHYKHVLSNPTKEKWLWFRQQGERATWPKISQIKTHARISQTLRSCIERLEMPAVKVEKPTKPLATPKKTRRTANAADIH